MAKPKNSVGKGRLLKLYDQTWNYYYLEYLKFISFFKH
jgi:hypothetical protein